MENTPLNISEKTSPKDVFLHLLAIITLYVAAGGLVTLLFQYVNVFFPDPLVDGYYSIQSAYGAIRWAISTLIIVFPVYVLTSWFLNKGYVANPSKRNLRIRKWLIYFTLFVAAVVIIGDLVTLIYNLLGGELTIRFFLKILAVLTVAGSIFSYYFWDVRKHKTE